MSKKINQHILIQYIKEHPGCTYQDIKRDTKIKVERIFSNMKEAYLEAKVPFSKNLQKLNRQEQKKKAIEYIKKYPQCTSTDLRDILGVNISRLFGGVKKAFQEAKIQYSKKSPTDGIRNPDVLKRCKSFENTVVEKLKTIGAVKKQVRIKNKILDCIFMCKGNRYVVEIKDFRARNNITQSQIKQLLEYMKLTDIKKGLIICPKESFPKRKNSRNLYIEGRNIKITSIEEILKGGVV